MPYRFSVVSSWLKRSNSFVFVAWCAVAAFITYFSMYAFRKPFTVAQYEGIFLAGVGFKVILLFSQILGYAISKFVGIKVVSEMTPARRAWAIILLVGIAHLALLPYAIVPTWAKPVCLFLNGLPLGMIFGCVFAFLEGRRVTEALAAGLCASFILASGGVKTVGAMLMEYYGVSQFWMPFLTGAIFWPTLLLGVWMLEQIPVPDERDVQHRAPRTPINRKERLSFYKKYDLGFSWLIFIVVMLTLFRSVRDDYAAEIWTGFGVDKPEIFAQSETIVAAVIVLISAVVVLIRRNYAAFLSGMALIAGGFVLAMITTLSYWNKTDWTQESAFQFMVLIGICLYVPYVLFHTTVFERLLALLRDKSNVGYLMYLGDFAGYISTVILMGIVSVVAKENIDFVGLLMWLAIIICPMSIVGSVFVVFYFREKQNHDDEVPLSS